MDAELLVVNGPRVGERFTLGSEVLIGRDPKANIRLDEPGVAWEHCIISRSGNGYRILDRRSGTGTYVNGMRAVEHSLEPGDQVMVGDTVFVYRQPDSTPHTPSPQHSLLHACSLLFLFRALASAENIPLRKVLEAQLVGLIRELVPATDGEVLLGRDPADWTAANASPELTGIAEKVCRDGAAVDAMSGTVGVPLYVRGSIAGLIATQFPAGETANLSEHCDTLAAIATLGAIALEAAREVQVLNTEKALLLERLDGGQLGIIGSSPALRRLMDRVARVAATDTSVLILGESGTGKEMVANALHGQSRRAAHPFVAINCAALTETLLESELFGHEKGAFTGAVAQKRGKLELAEGGTVFLDEIGELAPSLQAKLLRVLQQREFERVGATRTLKLDVRLVAATNRDLAAEVRKGTFREDLYHRLNVVAFQLPPLRERREDIPALAAHFLERFAARCGRRVRSISPEAMAYLMAYPWPGNVRELENAIERAVVLGESDMLLTEDLPETVLDAAVQTQAPGALQGTVTDAKRQSIIRAWEEAGGDYKIAAAKLNIHPNSLLRLVRNLRLREVLKEGS
ncbi:MAG: sigma 54-dependent Fis family transcriptional regulator [Acidobacteriia bacterium]|nr:sigma 54-dependent Fis family transcriptional regulator [Terriglobia bacterium]